MYKMLYCAHMTEPTLSPIMPWYKARSGKLFLGFLGVVAALLVIFVALTSYYVWQIKQGNASKLSAQFSSDFTFFGNEKDNSERLTLPVPYKSLIRDHSPVLGDPNAPITIIQFIDFECPFCQASYPITKTIFNQFDPAVKVVFKHLPVEALHPDAMLAHLASTCAHEQGKFWEYYDRLFISRALDKESLRAHAERVGLEIDKYDSCLRDERYMADILVDLQDAANADVRGTPTYAINNTKAEGALSVNVWTALILQELDS